MAATAAKQAALGEITTLLGRGAAFEGKLTSSKWAKIEKCSPDTALRDIKDLVDRGILRKDEGGGRSTSYSLAGSP